MRSTLFALTALGALTAAAPAVAQSYGYQNGYYGNTSQNGSYGYSGPDRDYYNRNGGYDDRAEANLSIDTRIARLEQRLNAGVSAGTIDRNEAAQLRSELRDLRRTNRQYGYGGLNASERTDILARLRSIGEDIRTAEGGSSYGYNNGYGSGSGYGGSYGNGYGNGYSNSYSGSYGNGYGSYGSTSNGYSGRGGPYEEADTYATLRVGDRAAGGLYGVPYELRNTYRDGWNYYYRSDGRAIYQIDSRTNTVLRVYALNR